MEQPYSVQLDRYEGPLDLLLDLIRKQEINIFDIPIARITQQYLDFLHKMEELDIDIAADFILIAATLIYIKARMLLPPDPSAPADEPLDPRTDLVARLLEHEKFKKAAEALHQKQLLEAATWSHPDPSGFEKEEGELVVTLWDLVKVFQQALSRPQAPPRMDIPKEEWTVGQMIAEVQELLRATDEPMPLETLFQRYSTRTALITTFLAVLELIRLEAVIAIQQEPLGPILLRKHRLFDVVFTRPGKMAAIDAEYQ
ncbi:MAG: segregation and condensation protein A [Terriglobia bacterium]